MAESLRARPIQVLVVMLMFAFYLSDHLLAQLFGVAMGIAAIAGYNALAYVLGIACLGLLCFGGVPL